MFGEGVCNRICLSPPNDLMPRLGGTSPQPAAQRQLHRSDLPLAEVQMATAKNGDFKKSSERRSRCVLLRHLSSRNDEIEAVGSGPT